MHREETIKKDIGVLAEFIEIYCRHNHAQRERAPVQPTGTTGEYLKDFSSELCAECSKLLIYSASMRIICLLDPKPRCKKCPSYCYSEEYRTSIRAVMKFSGMHLLKRGRLDLLRKYFF